MMLQFPSSASGAAAVAAAAVALRLYSGRAINLRKKR
jgi:hypothetical protein